jgi:hypothetical protein
MLTRPVPMLRVSRYRPFGNAALATRAVSSGTGSTGPGCRHMASLRWLDFELKAQYATAPENSPAVSFLVNRPYR